MTRNRLAAAAAVAASLWTWFAAPAAAQDGTTPLALAPGAPLGSYPLGDLDHVDLFGGGLSFRLPLVTVEGRGEARSQAFLVIEQHWGLAVVNQFQQYEPRFNWFRNLEPGYTAGAVTVWQDTEGVFPNALYLTRMTFTAADHTQHELRDIRTEGFRREHGFNRGRVFKSFDGSNLTFVADQDVVEIDGMGSGGASGRLMFPNGVEYRVSGLVQQVRDRNGNTLRFTYQPGTPWLQRITDSLNRQVNFADVDPNSTEHLITFRGFGGAAREIRVSYGPLDGALIPGDSIQTLAELFPTVNWYAPDETHNPFVAKAATLPDGRAYTFRYNSYGELARVELPTGGVLSYAYVTAGVSSEWIYRRLSQKSVYSGDEEVTRTTFTVVPGLDQITVVNHHDPSAPEPPFASERHHFYGVAQNHLSPMPPATYPDWQAGKEFLAEFLDEAGNVRKTVQHTWRQHANVPWPVPPSPPVAHDPRVVDTLTTLDPGPASVSALTTFTHDLIDNHYFNLTDVREFDFDGSLRRRKQTVFDYSEAYFRDDVHLRQLPLVARVFEGESTVRAETGYEYDAYSGGLLPRGDLTGRLSPDPYGAGFLRRGNPTAVRRWLDTTGEFLVTRFAYDVAGNVVRETSPRGFVTQLLYEDRFGSPDGNAQGNARPDELPAPLQTFALVTEAVNALSHHVFTQHDYYTARAVDQEDANAVVSSAWFDDPLDRPTRVVSANSHAQRNRTTHEYADDQHQIITRRDQDTFADGLIRTEMHYDGLGREVESRLIEPGGGYVAVRKEYDAKGRLRFVSNPHRPPAGFVPGTVTEYDALDRVRSVTAPGGGVTFTEHVANTATVTDPAGKSRKSVVDALGRVVQVTEDPGGLGYSTAYEYNALDDLVRVAMNHPAGNQQRLFAHDSLARLTSSSNPESGTVTYRYDPNGNLDRRVDARGIVTTYAYDELDRPRTILYTNEPPGSETPDVAYSYDAPGVSFSTGRLTRVSSSASVTDVLGYDSLGRVTSSQQTTAGQAYGVHYAYDLAGHLASQTYPSGRVVTTTFDRAERVEAVTSRPFQGTDRPYADHVRYAAHGGLEAVRLGNLRWDLTSYNDRLQPRFLGLNSFDSTGDQRDIVQIENRYGGLPQNNGNVREQIITAPGFSKTQTYSYDGVNRLQTAVEAGSWTHQYAYDRFGNRAVTGNVLDPTQSPSSLGHFSGLTNRITTAFDPDILYDASGNLTRDARGWTYLYDAENRQVSAQTGSSTTAYHYDAQGRRVRKVQAATPTTFVYDLGGKLLADYGGPGPTLISFITTDHLGTTRLITDGAGAVRSRHDHYPFGEEIPASIGGRSEVPGYGLQVGVRHKFTGKERDFETGLDFFQARYFSGPQGRFTSTDPLFNWAASAADPQRWHRYAYVRNNPLRHVDPDGHDVGEAAAWVQERVHAGNEFVINTAVSHMPPLEAAQITFLSEAAARVVSGFADMFRVGESTGTALGRGYTGLALAAAVSEDWGRAGGIVLLLAPTPKTMGIGKAGDIGERLAAREFERGGGQILGRQLQVRTSEGAPIADLFGLDAEGFAFIEAKTGGSPLTPAQTTGYPLIRSEGGTILRSGGRAAEAGIPPGTRIGPTRVIEMRFPKPRPPRVPPLWVPEGPDDEGP